MVLVDLIHKKLESGDLPGQTAQLIMAHAFRRKIWPTPDEARQAGVLILLYPKYDDWHIVFIERTKKNPDDVHGGQISLPGGKQEPFDQDIIACALREASEEVGITAGDVTVFGKLTPLYIPVSNFLVHPVMGKVDYAPTFVPQPSEVQSIIELPLLHFLREENVKQKDILFGSGMRMEDVPYFDAFGKEIWGATAMIMSEIKCIVAESHIQIPGIS